MIVTKLIPERFKMGVRVLMLIDRETQNSNKGSKRWISKIITNDPDRYDRAVEKLVGQMEYLQNPGIRLYASINARKLDSAIRMFKHKQIDLPPDQVSDFYRRINENFVSCLMKPECKDGKLFLLDVDSPDPDEAIKFCMTNGITSWHAYKSVSGYHIIVAPFNPDIAKDCKSFEIKRDALMLVAHHE